MFSVKNNIFKQIYVAQCLLTLSTHLLNLDFVWLIPLFIYLWFRFCDSNFFGKLMLLAFFSIGQQLITSRQPYSVSLIYRDLPSPSHLALNMSTLRNFQPACSSAWETRRSHRELSPEFRGRSIISMFPLVVRKSQMMHWVWMSVFFFKCVVRGSPTPSVSLLLQDCLLVISFF